MMRRVRLLALLLGVLSVLAVPSYGSFTSYGEGILLRGSRTAYVDLTVYVSTTVSQSDLQMKTKGSYVGFFLSPAPANRDTVGALVMPRVGATGADSASTMQLGQSWTVGPGRYRAFLITNGPAEVFIPITGQAFRGWVPSRRAPLAVKAADFNIKAGSAGASKRVPAKLRARSLVVVAGLATSKSLTAVDELGSCITDAQNCATTIALNARVPAAQAWTYGADLVPAGSYAGVVSVHRLGGTDAGSHVAGAFLVLTIGRQT
jgi:hypothetical protein